MSQHPHHFGSGPLTPSFLKTSESRSVAHQDHIYAMEEGSRKIPHHSVITSNAHHYSPISRNPQQNAQYLRRPQYSEHPRFSIPPLPAQNVSVDSMRRENNGNTLTSAERRYFENIDVNNAILTELTPSVSNNVMDLGKLGLVLHKYDLHKKLDQTSYEAALNGFSHRHLTLLPNVSELGEINPRVYQLAQTFFLNATSKMMSTLHKKQVKTSDYMIKPSFVPYSDNFVGEPPFKVDQILVSMHQKTAVPNDTQRAITYVIRNVLAQILDTETGHQKFAIRSENKNVKTNYTDLPQYASDFLQSFCLASFGYPPEMLAPGYTLERLSMEHPALAAKLGKDEDERQENFSLLLQDVHKFNGIIFEKMQRTFHDLRKSVLRSTHHHIHGEQFITKDFVMKSRIQRPGGDQGSSEHPDDIDNEQDNAG